MAATTSQPFAAEELTAFRQLVNESVRDGRGASAVATWDVRRLLASYDLLGRTLASTLDQVETGARRIQFLEDTLSVRGTALNDIAGHLGVAADSSFLDGPEDVTPIVRAAALGMRRVESLESPRAEAHDADRQAKMIRGLTRAAELLERREIEENVKNGGSRKEIWDSEAREALCEARKRGFGGPAPVAETVSAPAPTAASAVPAPVADAVNHPSHYTSSPSGIECITVVEHLPFNVGSAIKYLWRAGLKAGAPTLQDYQKALWYVKREISRLGLDGAANAKERP